MDKRKAIAHYFSPFPKWAVWFVIIGLILIFVGAKN